MVTITPNPGAPVSARTTEQKAAAKKAREEIKQAVLKNKVWRRLITEAQQHILGVLQEAAMEVAGKAHPKERDMREDEINAAYLALLNIAEFSAEALAAKAAGYATFAEFEAAQRKLGEWRCALDGGGRLCAMVFDKIKTTRLGDKVAR